MVAGKWLLVCNTHSNLLRKVTQKPSRTYSLEMNAQKEYMLHSAFVARSLPTSPVVPTGNTKRDSCRIDNRKGRPLGVLLG